MRYELPGNRLVDIGTREEARDFAIQWQADFARRDYSWSELQQWGAVFDLIGLDFDLLEEFKENGII